MEYADRFRQPIFWSLAALVVADLLAVFVPVLALALMAVLLMPEGWRPLDRLVTAIRAAQGGPPRPTP